MELSINIQSDTRLQMQDWIVRTVLLHLCTCSEGKQDPDILWRMVDAYERISIEPERRVLRQESVPQLSADSFSEVYSFGI